MNFDPAHKGARCISCGVRLSPFYDEVEQEIWIDPDWNAVGRCYEMTNGLYTRHFHHPYKRDWNGLDNAGSD